jgi:hypothetical protein
LAEAVLPSQHFQQAYCFLAQMKAQEVQKYSGIAPVIKQSGQNCVVQGRRACPRFLHQSLVEYAAKSILHCGWAKAFYEQRRAQGKG